jgi:hypothetical protein
MADVQQLIQLCQANPVPVAVALVAVIVTIVLALRGSGAAKAFLDPQQFKPLTLIRIDQLTHNTKRFVFALPDPYMRLGLPTGQHITFLAKDDEGKDVYRCVLLPCCICSGWAAMYAALPLPNLTRNMKTYNSNIFLHNFSRPCLYLLLCHVSQGFIFPP